MGHILVNQNKNNGAESRTGMIGLSDPRGAGQILADIRQI
jgi:hypothetical protein